MDKNPYVALAEKLSAVGLATYMGRSCQMVVSTQRGPVWPTGGNSFWLSYQENTWFLCTWAPFCYRIPPGRDVVALCVACMEGRASAMFRVPVEIVERFGLQLLDDDEFERLFPEGEEDER